jgi:hypothetical protein
MAGIGRQNAFHLWRLDNVAEVGNHIGPQLSQPVEEGESSAPAVFRVARFMRTDEKTGLNKLPKPLP